MTAALEITILGCGSSGGVPRANGNWGACDPSDPRNRRSRCSMVVRRLPQAGDGQMTTVLVDTSPDFRTQSAAAGLARIDAAVFTHDHADQTHGLDDLRAFAGHMRRRVPCHMDETTFGTLTRRFAYIFEGAMDYPPICDAHHIPPHGETWNIAGPSGDIPILTFPQIHGPIPSVGYRFGGVAYSSDVSALPDTAFAALEGLDLWIVDALRWTPHPTHASVAQALEWIDRVKPKRAVLTNMHIDLDYEALARDLPDHVEPAYDGWRTVIDL